MLHFATQGASAAVAAMAAIAPPAAGATTQPAPSPSTTALGGAEYAERSTAWRSFSNADAEVLENEWTRMNGAGAAAPVTQRDMCVDFSIPVVRARPLHSRLPPTHIRLALSSSAHARRSALAFDRHARTRSTVNVEGMGLCVVSIVSKGETLGMVLYLDDDIDRDEAGWKVRRSVQASQGSAYLEGSKWKCTHCGTMTSNASNTCTSCGVCKGH